MFAVLHAALAVVLGRFAATRDLTLGTTVSTRGTAESAVVGPLENTVVLRTAVPDGGSFTELVRACAATAAAARAHGELPFPWLLEAVRPDRALNRHPLCQVVLDVAGPVPGPDGFGGLAARTWEVPAARSPYDLRVRAVPEHEGGAPHGMDLLVDYSRELFDEPTARRLAEAVLRLLADATDAPGRALDTFDILDDAERDRLLTRWNATARPIPDSTVADLFEARVRARPQAPAVVHAGRTTTYAELDARANRIARALAVRGAAPGAFVALVLPRGIDLVASLLAVAKTGAAYLPDRPGVPGRAHHLRAVRHRRPSPSSPTAAPPHGCSAGRGRPSSYWTTRTPRGSWPRCRTPHRSRRRAAPCRAPTRPRTSSTPPAPPAGPRAWWSRHRALANFVAAMAGLLTADRPTTCWTAVTTVAFDVAALELFLPLTSGARPWCSPTRTPSATRRPSRS